MNIVEHIVEQYKISYSELARLLGYNNCYFYRQYKAGITHSCVDRIYEVFSMTKDNCGTSYEITDIYFMQIYNTLSAEKQEHVCSLLITLAFPLMDGKLALNRLKELRISNKLTYAAIASKLSVSTSYYWNFESGYKRDTRLLFRLADFYNVSVPYLFGINSQKHEPNSALPIFRLLQIQEQELMLETMVLLSNDKRFSTKTCKSICEKKL